MIQDGVVNAMIPTKDLARARAFYEGMLGLKGRREAVAGAVSYDCGGGSWFLLYEMFEDVTPGPTVACWSVGDIQAEVSSLQAQGVEFVEFDLPGATRQGAVSQLGDVGKGAWFKDPDGNVLQLFEAAS